MSNARTQKIEQLQQRLEKLQNEQRIAEIRARAMLTKASRAADTRRKILVGAFLLERLGASGVATMSVQGVRFSAWLERGKDLALFDLPQATPPTGEPRNDRGEA